MRVLLLAISMAATGGALGLCLSPPPLSASSFTLEVEDHALRLRMLHTETPHTFHLTQHLDLFALSSLAEDPLSPLPDDAFYHTFAAELVAPFGALAVGALRTAGLPLLLYAPLGYSARSDHHYRAGAVRPNTTAAPSTRNGIALSYYNILRLHAFGYLRDDMRLNAFVGATFPIGDALLIEQWNSIATIDKKSAIATAIPTPEERATGIRAPRDSWWFEERFYFFDDHLYFHALKAHLKITPLHLACGGFIQHSPLHFPQYAATCSLQLRTSDYQIDLFGGIQSEYYTDEDGDVLDEWLALRLHYTHTPTDTMRIALSGEATAYKPEWYYRTLTIEQAVPRISLSAEWRNETPIALPPPAAPAIALAPDFAIGYGAKADFYRDWRADAEYSLRVRLTPSLFVRLDPFLLELSFTAVYGEPQWQELIAAIDAHLTIDEFEATILADYTFDLPDERHAQMDVGLRLSYSLDDAELYGQILFRLIDFEVSEDVLYKVGVRVSLE